MRLIDFFDRAAALYPERIFVKQGKVERSYRESQKATHRIAAALQYNGFRTGARIGLYTHNDWRGLETIFGLCRAGCVMTPVNARNALRQNIGILKSHGVEALFFHSAFAEDVGQVAAACPDIRLFVCLDRACGDHPKLTDWMAPEGTVANEVPHCPEDLWAIYSTSGTTGESKGVCHTHLTNLVTSMDMLHAMRVHEAVRHLVVAPMTHFAGTFIFALTIVGSTHLLHDKVEPAEVLAAISAERIEVLFLPPTAIYRLLAEPDLRAHDYSSLSTFAYAAAPMASDKLKQAISAFGPVMMNMFGQAEALGPVCFLPPEDHRPGDGEIWEQRLRAIGRPSIMRQVEIMDETGRLLPPGEAGEVVIRSWGVTPGYLNDPVATEEVKRHGWYHTGDIGTKDSDGYVTLVDRKKDMIVSGGFNVFSAEVEQVLLSHEAVLEAAVIGVPDETWGEAVKAVVELHPNRQVPPETLIALCKRELGSVKAPKTLEIRDSLPRNATGKVLKRQIRDLYWAGHARKI
ncbi:MAG: AMP-binding protein [Kiloniellales bacterium]